MADYDVIVIGGGPNGLTTAGLLQAQGEKVACLEKNSYIGGLASNAHEFPGYTHNRGMWYLMFAKMQETLKSLELEKYGLKLLDPEHVIAILPLPENYGDPVFRMYNDGQETMQDIEENFGKETAKGFADFMGFLHRLQPALTREFAGEPTSPDELINSLETPEERQDMRTLLYGTAMELADRFFPDKRKQGPIRGYIASMCTDGFYGGPMTPGSALTLAYHFGTPSEGEGVTGSQFKMVKGGTGAFSEALAKSFAAHGGNLIKNAEVSQILVENNKAIGVQLSDGREITADNIVSGIDAYQTFIKLVGKDATPSWLTKSIKEINFTDTITQSYYAFNKLPSFTEDYDQLNHDGWRFSVWNMGSSELFEDNWDAVKEGRVPKYVSGGISFRSMVDPSLAPEGHYSGVFCTSPSWPIGTQPKDYAATKEKIFNSICAYYEKFMPDFRDCIDDYKVWSPVDFENEYNNTGGAWSHGPVQIDQMFDMRPVKGMSNFRAPIQNLYLCDSSNHPGPGYNGRAPFSCVKAMETDGVLKGTQSFGSSDVNTGASQNV
ncbi:phytoene desaturase family protein [Secundilactobacillus collinoides]|uniref:Pyridine nucleotide-disulfide oxidoreductase domain-containing protein 2 n=2 Tax=Secundilactobacillus collinoides TaxID=33960 RepID=A0A0R2BJ30_SECCO|nr:NAD(P)/FAD-dependent oxidoreductase [Secundilactobacillus collinoides]KRM77684.1 hypothetical protein FC82_GL003055 [Secundilactobacillus collinoides DSM 20515 = JCM 1123]KZL38869.1 hypothetical protein TY91_11175 [Secundilactobacillus collinoides]